MKNRYIQIFSFLIALLSFATFPACELDDEINFVKGITISITTHPITDIGSTYAVAGGVVKATSNNTVITERGVVYSTSPNPTIERDNEVSGGSGLGSFGCNLLDLLDETKYYVRAYAINGYGKVLYGEEKSFTTNRATYENGHEYIDLGLSVKWATMNVGASKAEDYGGYYAWGETTTKSTYNWSTYKWCNGSSSTLTKYNTSSSFGTVDNKMQLDLSDDAARANWEGSWRMPTKAEWTELCVQCTWTRITQNGVEGYKVTSKNGNFIFLPAAGYRDDTSLYRAGINGCYWSSALYTFSPYGAWRMGFDPGYVYRDYYERYYGLSVRPVLGENESGATTPPTMTTAVVTQITETSAVVGGNVTSDGGASVTERGVVYSTKPNPVITNLNNTIRPCGSGTGEFTYTITGLQPNKTYYVRAYAKNDVGTAYGEEVSFTTKVEVVDNPSSNLRAMSFSVSESKQVYFSKGNLQCHPANNEWRFAENQTDNIGNANSNCSSTYNGWLDLFGWSTSATNFGVSTSEYDDDYSGSFVDWGMNKIGNDAPNTWRTLTYDEWYYLRYTRTNADDLVGIAQVNGVNGLILLPDNWVAPDGIAFKSGFHINNGIDYYAAYQTFTAEQWSKLESAGAVFLPAAGSRGGSYVVLVQDYGYYWSATEYNSRRAYCLGFDSDGELIFNHGRFNGISVRLVKNL